ncbi:MAG: AraC family ligand binding domain-containing protein [Chloroflexota bacterium]
MRDPILPGGLQPLALGDGATPNADAVAAHLRAEGVDPSSWSNGSGDRYAAHSHAYIKLLMCAAGSITFLVGEAEEPLELHPGQGFVLPPGTQHAAIVGPDGCTCVEGHR